MQRALTISTKYTQRKRIWPKIEISLKSLLPLQKIANIQGFDLDSGNTIYMYHTPLQFISCLHILENCDQQRILNIYRCHKTDICMVPTRDKCAQLSAFLSFFLFFKMLSAFPTILMYSHEDKILCEVILRQVFRVITEQKNSSDNLSKNFQERGNEIVWHSSDVM